MGKSVEEQINDFFGEVPPREFDVVFRGYDRRQVQDVIDRVESTLGGRLPVEQRITAAELREVGFRTAVRGYAREQVDAALREFIAKLEA